MSDAPELNSSPAKTAEAHPLDVLTGGAFSAATSGERAARIREWLAKQPSDEQLQEVFKELSIRDKGVARLVRERMDDIRRAKDQEVIAVEWAKKAQTLLDGAVLNVVEAVAWQRDAAKAGAPLSREPLSILKQQLVERVKTIEDLQHRVQVQREAAVLLAQRIEVLSTKSWKDADFVLEGLSSDVARWQEQAEALMADSSWASVNERFPPQLETSRSQLLVVWDAFREALAQTKTAAADAQAPLPTVPVWADEIRVLRGLPSELSAAAPEKSVAKTTRPDTLQKQQTAMQLVQEALQGLKQVAEQEKQQAIAALRTVLKQQGRWLDEPTSQQVHEQLLAAGDQQGWQPKSADRMREELIAKAESLSAKSGEQPLSGRRLQETLRQLREQWKQIDQAAPPNHGLWKKFDEACNTAYKQVQEWLDKVRAESVHHKTSRLALIEEVKEWASQHAEDKDLKAVLRALRQFSDRWRESGHVGEKVFTELQAAWKQAMSLAEAPLVMAQKESLERRNAMIAEAQALAQAPVLRVDMVKTLQQRWQAEAQAVPLERKHEQKLWDAFRKPLDEAFNRKGAERQRLQPLAADLPAHDRAVLDAVKVLQAANATADAQQIRLAMAALEQAVRNPPETATSSESSQAVSNTDAATADTKPERSVVAVRGDDRPDAKKEAIKTATRETRLPARKDVRARPERTPRLGALAFRAQREAIESAQFALRKLAAQAHGEALSKLMTAWAQRDVQGMPSAQELGSKVSAQARNAWSQAIASSGVAQAGEALLRLEIAADISTPAEEMAARRMLQLQLLTRRNEATPAETWLQDTAKVLATTYAESTAYRLQNALKQLLRK